MAQAIANMRTLAIALDLCHNCEAKLTGDRKDEPPPKQNNEAARSENLRPPQLDLETPLSSNEVQYLRSTLTNVHITNCSFHAFTVQNCDLENVKFRNCTMTNVTFHNLKLKDVAFSNLDFRNVVIKDLAWEKLVWRNASLENAVVDGACFLRVKNKEKLLLPILTRGRSDLSRTVVVATGGDRAGVVDAGMKVVEVVERETMGLLRLPEKILDRIMQYLFPRSRNRYANTILMSDTPTSSLPSSTSQTTYTHLSPFGYLSPQFTYHGWPYPHPTTSHSDAFRLNFSTSLLLVSKSLYDLSIGHIYDRTFYFDKPERCLAFLHDHQAPEHQSLSIVLQYSSQTDPAAWRRLFDVLVRGREVINELTLEISSEIWMTTAWKRQDRAEGFLSSWRGWANMWPIRDARDVEKTFLQHVGTIPGSRLDVGQRTGKAEDVRFFLRIQGSKGFPSREAFCDELQLLVRQKMLMQGEGEMRGKRECCGLKELVKSCYWS